MKKYFSIIAMAAVAFVACQPKDTTVYVESVKLDQTAVTLNVGETVTLTATVLPENAATKTVTWSSSDESVATVANGKVTAVKIGNATITVKTTDGEKTATCAVTVKAIDWTAVYTETYDANPIRTAFNTEGAWAVFSLNQDASMKASLAFGYVDGVYSLWTPNAGSVYASSYWDAPCETDSWIVSPVIDLSSAKYAKMNFDESQMYGNNDDYTVWATIDEGIQPLGSQEGIWWGGPVDEAPKGTWEALVVPNHAAMKGDTYEFIHSGDVDLNGFAGEKIRVAFRYKGHSTGAGTWNWDNIAVYAGN